MCASKHLFLSYRLSYTRLDLNIERMICVRHWPNSSKIILSAWAAMWSSFWASSAWASRQPHVASTTSRVMTDTGHLSTHTKPYSSQLLPSEKQATKAVHKQRPVASGSLYSELSVHRNALKVPFEVIRWVDHQNHLMKFVVM